MVDALDAGRHLADRHELRSKVDTDRSLFDYAELSFPGDWTLRSSLCRLAQPEPVRVSAILELMRRLDLPLHHLRRAVERYPVECDRAIDGAEPGAPPGRPYVDGRAVDLARLVAGGADAAALVRGYEQRCPLDQEERLAVPLLAIAVEIEQLAETLTGWALVGPADPPVGAIDQVCLSVAGGLDRLGVPSEVARPGRSGRS